MENRMLTIVTPGGSPVVCFLMDLHTYTKSTDPVLDANGVVRTDANGKVIQKYPHLEDFLVKYASKFGATLGYRVACVYEFPEGSGTYQHCPIDCFNLQQFKGPKGGLNIEKCPMCK